MVAFRGKADIVWYGISPMGENAIRNLARKGYKVVAVNRTLETTHQFAEAMKREGLEGRVVCVDTLKDAVSHLRKGGAVAAMIKAHDPRADDTTKGSEGGIDGFFFTGSESVYQGRTRNIPAAVKLFKDKDVVFIDFANSHPESTYNRIVRANGLGRLYVGSGMSGGARGALEGPAIMPGGSLKAYNRVAKMLCDISAKFDGKAPCCDYMGDNEAGHFVKNVHNGVEYIIMSAIAETYNSFRVLLGAKPYQLQPIFKEWAKEELSSYLMDITVDILGMPDVATDMRVLDVILDKAGQKGTGKWTTQIFYDLGAIPTAMGAALSSRITSSFKDERVKAAELLKRPEPRVYGWGEAHKLIDDAKAALYATTIVAYSEGFDGFTRANEAKPEDYGGRFNFEVDHARVAKVWRAGCIVRSSLLPMIAEAYSGKNKPASLMLAFNYALENVQEGWRNFNATLLKYGLPREAISAALCHYDHYGSAQSPANMIQAQRSFFGQHEWRRNDDGRIGHHLDALR